MSRKGKKERDVETKPKNKRKIRPTKEDIKHKLKKRAKKRED